MKKLISYTFKSTQIRTTLINNEPWFVATDVAQALEYRDSEHATRYLDDDERDTLNQGTPGKQLTIINESGLYSLILRSRKPEAKAFKKFVTAEVLPAIRRQGYYGTPAPVDMRAIGGIVKRCVNKALTDFLSAELPASDDVLRQKYYNVTDKDMAETLQRWYWSRNYDTRQTIDALTRENDLLKCKIATIRKTIN